MPELPSESAAPPPSPALAASPTLLDRAEQAHRSGHFAEVRSLLAQLAAPRSPADRERAEALRARLRPDPLVALLIVACLILFVAVVGSTWR